MLCKPVFGIFNFVIFPGEGRKFLEGSSAYNLHSIACPDFLILLCSIDSISIFNANLICIVTKSKFVTASVTGCST